MNGPYGPYDIPQRGARPLCLLSQNIGLAHRPLQRAHPSLGAPPAQERPRLGDSLVLFPAEFPQVVDLRARQMRRHEAGGTLSWPDGQSGRRRNERRLGPES